MFFTTKKSGSKGFSLIELLVVISIIGLLTSVVLSNLTSARGRARDAKRALEMQTIFNAINLFYDQYDCLPKTSGTTCAGAAGYSEANAGGWDYSSQGGFLTFLRTSGVIPNVPIDPLNNMTGDATPVGTYSYRYYCYSGSPAGLHLGYWSEKTGGYVFKNNLTSGGWADSSYTCK